MIILSYLLGKSKKWTPRMQYYSVKYFENERKYSQYVLTGVSLLREA